jgi:hypothetical protein
MAGLPPFQYQAPGVIPINGVGVPISVNVAPYVFNAGDVATLWLTLNPPGNTTPIELSLSPNTGGSIASYVRVGGEFAASGPGWYDVQVKITNTGFETFSFDYRKGLFVQGTQSPT